MFEYMTNSQIAALIVGIVFSIISIATTFLAIKYAKKINSFAKVASMALVAPFVAFAGWLFLIFSFLDGFRKDELLNLIISIILSLIIAGMIIIVAKALYSKHRDEFEEETEETALEEQNVIDTANENTENNTLLLENKTIEEENENAKETNSEEQEQIENEINEENILNQITEEQKELKDENDAEESEIEKNNEEEQTINYNSSENDDQNIEENVENNENVDENQSQEIQKENVEENEEDKDIDKEFEEFLETLRKKVEENQNKPTDDNE